MGLIGIELKEFARDRKISITGNVSLDSIMKLHDKIVDIKDSDERMKTMFNLEGMEYIPKPLELTISTYGGDGYMMMHGYDIISQNNVNTTIAGVAMSAGIVLTLGGKIRRCYPNTVFMIHDGLTIAWGKQEEIQESLDQLKFMNERLFNVIVENTKITRKKLEKIRDKKIDWYITAEEALKLGIVHEIIR